MVPHDDEIVFEPSDELIERVAKRGKQPRKPRNKLHHLLRTAQGNAAKANKSKGGVGMPTPRKPSLPPTPWDKKD